MFQCNIVSKLCLNFLFTAHLVWFFQGRSVKMNVRLMVSRHARTRPHALEL